MGKIVVDLEKVKRMVMEQFDLENSDEDTILGYLSPLNMGSKEKEIGEIMERHYALGVAKELAREFHDEVELKG